MEEDVKLTAWDILVITAEAVGLILAMLVGSIALVAPLIAALIS